MNSRRYFAAKTQDESKIEFQLIQSIYQNDEAAFEVLIESIDSVDTSIGTGKSKWTSLMFAVHKKRYNIVRKLLEMGADPNCIDKSNQKSCLHSACTFGYGKIARLLLETGKVENINYNENAEGESPIFSAVKKGRKYCVELLLNYPLHGQICDINVCSKTNGQSPLFIACDKGDAEIVKLLINYKYMKCDMDQRDNKGYTALMKAVGKNHVDVVQLLLDKKPNLSLVNHLKQCAAMIAVRTNHYESCKMLLDQDSDETVLYRRDYRSRTIFDLCIKHYTKDKIIECVKQLLHINIKSVIESINNSKYHQNVPYLPNGVVQFICNMTY